MADPAQDAGLRRGVRRAVGGALEATVGRVGHTVTEAAMEVTGATAQQVIEDLEPYLIEEAVPRIVHGLTPYLTDTLVPEVLEDLRPYLEAELVPRIVESLMPYLQEQVAPDLIDALMPKIRDEVAPQLIEALMPRIEEQVAPQLVDALMPKIRDEVAPELVDSLLPKIRAEVVPLILDDIIDDPRVRDLIREQSQGLFLDALESVRENLADTDVLVERFGRRLVRKPARPQAESAVTLMLDGAGGEDTTPARLTRANLAEQRGAWRAMPIPPAPPGREFAHAGAVTRVVAFALDSVIVAWLVSQGLSALVSLLDTIFDPAPTWLVAGLTAIAASLFPVYLGVCWWLSGRTIGSWLVGTRVCTPDGRNPGLIRAQVRAWVGVLGFLVWLISGVFSIVDPKRRPWLDRLMHTEVRYVVPLDQQRRYIRAAMQDRQAQAEELATQEAA